MCHETYKALFHSLMKKQIHESYSTWKIPIHTVDTDVVILSMTSAQRLNITELWIAFGARKNFRYLPAHEMANALGLDSCVSLPMFHAFTGCDTVSCFGSKSKRTAWDMGNAYDEVTPAFCALAATMETLENWLYPLERLLILLYDCTSSQEFVNEARNSSHKKVELLSSDTSSTYPAHKAGCSPSRSLLGKNINALLFATVVDVCS